jgi:hypothetical protein
MLSHTITLNNNNMQAFLIQVSWGRLEMKPIGAKKKKETKTHEKKKGKKKCNKKTKIKEGKGNKN